MPSHEWFEELCALAAAGEISPAQHQELMSHLEQCVSCRKTFEELKDIHALWLPEREGFEIKRSFAAEARVRQSILRRVEQDGARFSREAQLAIASKHSKQPSYYSLRWMAAAVVIIAVLGGVALLLRPGSRRSAPHPSATAQLIVRDTQPSKDSELEALRERVREADAARTKLEASLKEIQVDRQRLERERNEVEERANTLQEASASAAQKASSLQAELDAARADYSRVEEQLAEVKKSSSDKETELALVDAENRSLRDRLDEETASIGRERELMADGREIRDLIAARNLHIIDVYDTSGEGRTEKSFGRVFYTEGKSLVFYAYDLPARRPASKYAFYAWGKRDVSGDVKVQNLGIFYNDDQTQKRWVLKFSDPQVLSEIDSVFVTIEKADGVGNAPRGERLLSAYLGTPANHP